MKKGWFYIFIQDKFQLEIDGPSADLTELELHNEMEIVTTCHDLKKKIVSSVMLIPDTRFCHFKVWQA